MINGDVIAKNEMTVKDDVFNSIVNGIKTPIEKVVDIQKAEKSNVYLKGKQLQRFKQKIIPEFTKSFQNEGLIHDYVQASREEYEKLKVEEVKAAYEASVQEIKEVNEEVDDELEEIESDKKGFIYFLKKGWTIFKWVTRLIRFYAYYRRIMKAFDESKAYINQEKRTSFDLNDYNFDKKLDVEKAKADFIVFLDEWGRNNIQTYFGPFLTYTTAAILTFADMAYNKINREITWWIYKELAIAGSAAALAFFTSETVIGSYVFGGIAAHRVYKITKTLNGILKFARLGTRFGKAYRKIRSSYENYKKLNYMQRSWKMYKKLKKLKSGYDFVHYGGQAVQVLLETGGAFFDIVSFSKKDLEEIRKDIRNYTQPLGKKIVNGISIAENMLLPDAKIAFDKLIASTKHVLSNFAKSLLGKYEEKYGTQIKVENFFKKDEKDKMEYTFEILLNSIGLAKEHFEKEHELKKTNYFPFVNNENGYIINGKEFTITQFLGYDGKTYKLYSYGNLVYNEASGVGLKEGNNTNNTKFFQYDDRFAKIKQVIVLDLEQGNGGKEFVFDRRFGGMAGVHLFFLSSEKLKDDTKFKIHNKFKDKVRVFAKKTSDRNIMLGVEKIQDETPIKTKIRNTGNNTAEEYVLRDLSEITNSRNEQLLQEKEFLEKAKQLKETIDKIVHV